MAFSYRCRVLVNATEGGEPQMILDSDVLNVLGVSADTEIMLIIADDGTMTVTPVAVSSP